MKPSLGAAVRLPGWVVRLLLAVAGAVATLYLVGRRNTVSDRDVDSFELEASRPRRRPGQRFIHVAGRGRVGKSAVANALAGAKAFGPDSEPAAVAPFRAGYWLHELPAAALSLGDAEHLQRHFEPGDIVILVVEEQPFHDDQRFLALLQASFPTVTVVVLINKADLLAAGYTTGEIDDLAADVRRKVAAQLGRETDLLWGAAAGLEGPQLQELVARLDQLVEA